ncbi:DUF4174 domain-containing protein [Christiangramia sp. OXR-203]|uniref:DUF4174 domain-containing protein n=1 Tax=Christiangramia sp. OXR-203 TaxID=3100176 RepID=UPI002AC92199|nr:DUF4174 domain-containing protein [Christiangramia sp. OXR-203]WPY98921.1 DUF4174 domain-containing protein [Christiangramia sp. OXR-203]
MRNLTFLIILIFYGMTSKAQDLQQYQWENRIIVVYSNETELDLVSKQLKLLTKEPKELSERKLILIQAQKNQYKTIFPENSEWVSSSLKDELKISTKTKFEVFLLGLDGGIKLRQQEIVQTEKLFSLIDGMPMRKAEIRRKDQ